MSDGNGSNDFGVGWGTINFFENKVLRLSEHVASWHRSRDIMFRIELRTYQWAPVSNEYTIVLAGGYVTSEANVMEFRAAFPEAQYIVLGGSWWKYTAEAELAASQCGLKILGLKEFTAAIRTGALP